MTFRVRKAQESDITQLVSFQMVMAQESEGQQLDEQKLTQGIAHVFSNPALGHYWVVEEESTHTVVAMCMMTFEWSDWHNGLYWWFQSVFVLPDYRGQGVVQLLMNTIAQEAAEQNAVELRLYVETQNERAMKAYAKIGYEAGHYAVMQKPIR